MKVVSVVEKVEGSAVEAAVCAWTSYVEGMLLIVW